MQLEFETAGEVLLVRIGDARLDASVAMEFRDRLAERIGQGVRAIALDFSRVEFMDSSGLGAMVSVRKQLGDAGALALWGLNGTVRAVLGLTRVDRVVAVRETGPEALAAARGE